MTTPATLPLRTGRALPSVGLGLWKVARPEAPGLVRDAIAAGYRHFDSAADYGNEAETGQGLSAAMAEGLCRREDLWITSKLWNTCHASEHVRPALERSLADLGLDYLDLYLIHFPIALQHVPFATRYPAGWLHDPDAAEPRMEPARVSISETWSAMEDLVRAGLARDIGVCNFGVSLIRDLLAHAEIPPAILQVESHPYLTQEKLLRYCREEQIAVTAFSPLGSLSYVSLGMAGEGESVLAEPAVQEIAGRLGKTPAQVVLRWGIQRQTAIVPKTSRRERLAENLALFDFALSAEDMEAISALDRGRRYNDPGEFGEAAFHTFMPIYE